MMHIKSIISELKATMTVIQFTTAPFIWSPISNLIYINTIVRS